MKTTEIRMQKYTFRSQNSVLDQFAQSGQSLVGSVDLWIQPKFNTTCELLLSKSDPQRGVAFASSIQTTNVGG
jgi:hypothetical protein